MNLSTASHHSTLKTYLAGTKWGKWTAVLCAADCSHRAYWRLTDPENIAQTRIAMVAPPALEETGPFIYISSLLKKANLHPPHIYYNNKERGLLILEDLGCYTYRQIITKDSKKLPEVYTLFNKVIKHLHAYFKETPPLGISSYTEELFWKEIEIFLTWYFPYTNAPALTLEAKKSLKSILKNLIKQALQVPFSLSLRDAMIDNFMYCPKEKDLHRCGILDFQDALWGPITYDLASMYHDARFDVPEPLIERLLQNYLADNPSLNKKTFMASFSILSVQRNLKILGIFSRQMYKYNKPQYLLHIPRIWRWLEKDLLHPSLLPLKSWIDTYMKPAHRCIPSKPISTKSSIDQAMIMCAGFGKRLFPITKEVPKPLLSIAGTTALGWLIEKLRSQGVRKIIINTHHLEEKVKEYIRNYDAVDVEFILNFEPELLGTGGGIYNALPYFNSKPFFVLNCDMIWLGNENPLASLASLYKSEMPIIIGLTTPSQILCLNKTNGYLFNKNNQPYRVKKTTSETAPYIFTGVRIMHPNLFNNLKVSSASFSILELFDKAEKNTQLYTHIYNDKISWWDLGELDSLKKTQSYFSSSFKNPSINTLETL